jgi:nucleoside-diphosphate kinase
VVEKTLVLVKPDGVQRQLVGQIISRFENKGLQLIGLKLVLPTRDLLTAHYYEHAQKPFFEGLVGSLVDQPVVAMIWSGPGCVATVRALVGATKAAEAAPGTIRGDLGMSRVRNNLVHASDSIESGEQESDLWFEEEGVHYWQRQLDEQIYTPGELDSPQ